MKNEQGITLVEAMVVGLIAAVIAGATWAFFSLYAREIDEGAVLSRLQMQADIIAQQITREVRRGYMVLDSGETTHAASYPGSTSTLDIVIWDWDSVSGRDTIAGFKIRDSVLYELDTNGDTMKSFWVGADTFYVDTSSKFFLRDTRDGVYYDLQIKTYYKDDLYSVPVRGMFRCRN